MDSTDFASGRSPVNRDCHQSGRQCLLSLIVPVYNSELYLEDCIKSVLAEQTDCFEVLLIDDGSSDGSGAICDRLAEYDCRVTAYHQKNSGMCHARNVGISKAQGKWIGFIDNDDLVLPGFVEDNISIAVETNCDCIVFGRRLDWLDGNDSLLYQQDSIPSDFVLYRGCEVKKNYLQLSLLSDAVWNRFFKRDVLISNEIRFDESYRKGKEDTKFNDDFFRVADSYVTNPNCYYVWKRRAAHSTSMGIDQNLLRSLEDCSKNEYSLMADFGLIESNIDGCAGRLFSMFFSVLTVNYMSNCHAYPLQKDLFAQINLLMKPYEELFSQGKLRADIEIAKRLLLKRKYLLLHFYLLFGSQLKGMLSRNRFK